MLGDASQRMIGIGIDITNHMKTDVPAFQSVN